VDERNKLMANQSIGKLLLNMSAPATVGMLVQAMYNLTDTIFVGRGLGRTACRELPELPLFFPSR